MIDSKTKTSTLVSRKQFRKAKAKIVEQLQIIEDAKRCIKVIRPQLVAYALREEECTQKYETYGDWLVNEYLQGKDEEQSGYWLYANMMVKDLFHLKIENND